jgi:tripartite-type tricarboxylate transporter receptor subunit TctC
MITANMRLATGNLSGTSFLTDRSTRRRSVARYCVRSFAGIALAACASITTAATDPQDTYPKRPVRLIVPQTSGGGTDIAARIFGQKLGEAFSQRVVIDNRPGAGGIIANELVATAAPSGYTLIMVSVNYATLPALHKTLPYDTVKDFAPISLLIAYPFLVAIHPSVPAKSVADLIATAKAKPGQINYASGGSGSSAHLNAELFRSLAGIDIVHVAYKGTAGAIVGLIAGEAKLGFYSVSALLPHVKAGRLHALATTGDKRASAFPSLPTVAEAGLPGFKAETWAGMLAPARTSGFIIDKLNRELIRSLQLSDVKQSLAALDFEPVGSTPQAFATVIREEVAKWSKVVKQSGAKPD